MKILVTGGCGSLGEVLARKINDQAFVIQHMPRIANPKLIAFDINPPIFNLNETIQYVQGSITDFDKLDRTMRQHEIDCVVHLAGWHGIHEDKKEKNEKDFEELNIKGTSNVLKASAKNKINKFIFMSSTSI